MTLHIPKKALLLGSAKLKPQDVFKTSLYAGTGVSGLTVTTGLDMAGKGGLTWIKARNAAFDHGIFDTARGARRRLLSNGTAAENDAAGITSWTSSGFVLGNEYGEYNAASYNNVSWSFLCAPKFFDIVTWVGNGVAGRQIPHSLGVVPGMITIKARSATGNWASQHRSIGPTQVAFLNLTNASAGSGGYWNNTAPTATGFTVGANPDVNAAGVTYVAEIWAHNPDLIDCGSYVQGSGDTPVTCGNGWETQFTLLKNATSAGNWLIFDAQRPWSSSAAAFLKPNAPDVEGVDSPAFAYPISQGFMSKANNFPAGNTILHLSIRKPY